MVTVAVLQWVFDVEMTVNMIQVNQTINLSMTFDQKMNMADLDTESKRVLFLETVRVSIKKTGGRLVDYNIFNLVQVFQKCFGDDQPSTRCTAMNLLGEILPQNEADFAEHLDALFPQLLQNLLNPNAFVKKSALQTMHVYFKYSQNQRLVLDCFIHYGIETRDRHLRNEVFLAIPALMRSGFTEHQLEEIFFFVVKSIPSLKKVDSSLPAVLCLEHIKDALGEEKFSMCLENLDQSLLKVYHTAISNSSLTGNPENLKRASFSIGNEKEMMFGFLTQRAIAKLYETSNWELCTEGCNDFIQLLNTVEIQIVKANCGGILDFLGVLLEVANVNVALPLLHLLHEVVMKVGVSIKVHLYLAVSVLLKRLNDPKTVIRKMNLRIALSLMHSTSPNAYIQAIIPQLNDKNPRVREETLNMIIAALLSFPNSDFDLLLLPSQIAFTLVDPKRRVRHAVLECFSVLAQRLGAGKLKPLVCAIDLLEADDADGALAAVQCRLRRRSLASLTEDGLVQYALSLPADVHKGGNYAEDITWIVCGPSDSRLDRRFSAGKKRLPWQGIRRKFELQTASRNIGGSAPVRKNSDGSIPHDCHKTSLADSWTHNNATNAMACSKQHNAYQRSDSSYLEHHKRQMRQIKAAGLQADSKLLNGIYSYQETNKYGQGAEAVLASPGQSPGPDVRLPLSPVNFALPLSPKRRPIKPYSPTCEFTRPVTFAPSTARKKEMLLREAEEMSKDVLSHTLPKTKNGQLRRMSLGESCSPFPSRPAIHRTPSGKVMLQPDVEIITNLQLMQKLSNSSPVISKKDKEPETFLGSSPSPLPLKEIVSPVIRTPRARQMKSPVTDTDSASANESSKLDDGSLYSMPENDPPSPPKFAKSPLDRMRNLKEEKQRSDAECAEKKKYIPLVHSNQNLHNPTIRQPSNVSDEDNAKVEEIAKLKLQQQREMDEEVRKWKESEQERKLEDEMLKKQKELEVEVNKKQKKAKKKKPVDTHAQQNSGGDAFEIAIYEGKKKVHDVDLNNNEHEEDEPSPVKPPSKKIQPKIGASPQVRRKNPPSSRLAKASTVKTSSDDIDQPLTNPSQSIPRMFKLIGSDSEEWEAKCDGLLLLRRLLRNHSECLNDDYNAMIAALIKEVQNLRSQVTRPALNCVADVFEFLPKLVEPNVEIILKTILPKAGDASQFIRKDCDMALESLSAHVHPNKAVAALVNVGTKHRNGQVRSLSARSIADIAENVEPSRIFQLHRDMLVITSKLATDSQPETRFHGRRILSMMLDNPELDQLLSRVLPTAQLKPVLDIVDNLKQKGMSGGPQGSANVRRSMRSSAAPPVGNRRKNSIPGTMSGRCVKTLE